MGIISRWFGKIGSEERAIKGRSSPQASVAPTRTAARIGGGRIAGGPAASETRRVTIGLDFGTSTTKVVVQLEHANLQMAKFLTVAHDHKGINSVLCPSTVAFANGSFLFGLEAEYSSAATKVRSFKMCLPCQCEHGTNGKACPRCLSGHRGYFRFGSTDVSAEDIATLYLAHVLKLTKEKLLAHLPGHALKIHVNSAAPLDQMSDGGELKRIFERTLFYAYRLSDKAMNPWPKDAALAELERVRNAPVTGSHDSPVTVFPETLAAMTTFLFGLAKPKGTFATIDVGAGTTDTAFFYFHKTGGEPEACYYAAKSEFVGIDDIDRVLQAVLDAADGRVRERREQLGQKGLEQHASRFAHVLDRMYEHYGQVFGVAYGNNRGEKEWVDGDGRAKYTLCVVGGGARVRQIVDRLSQPLSRRLRSFRDVDLEMPDVPDRLQVMRENGRTEPLGSSFQHQRSLLLLAFGLAHRAVDVPLWQEGYTFERRTLSLVRVSHEEIYGYH